MHCTIGDFRARYNSHSKVTHQCFILPSFGFAVFERNDTCMYDQYSHSVFRSVISGFSGHANWAATRYSYDCLCPAAHIHIFELVYRIVLPSAFLPFFRMCGTGTLGRAIYQGLQVLLLVPLSTTFSSFFI